MTEAIQLATLSRLIKPIFTKINEQKFVILDGTPVPYGIFLEVFATKLTGFKASMNFIMENHENWKHRGVTREELLEYKGMGYLIPEQFFVSDIDIHEEIHKFIDMHLRKMTMQDNFETLADIEIQSRTLDA